MSSPVTLESFAVGDKAISPARTLTDADVAMFDRILARGHHGAEGSTGPLAAELLMVAMASGLMFRTGGLALPPSTLALWSLKKVEFHSPARSGATIHLESTVVECTKIDAERGLLAVRHDAYDERSELVLSCTTQMVVPRSREEAAGGAGEP